jgi:glucitol/sorbitol PTS system EIIA component
VDPTVRYQSTVTGVGELAGEFFAEGIVVLFGDDAPEELLEVAVVHAPQVTEGGLEPGDRIVLGDETLTITAVGPVANENLVDLGHLVIKRNGAQTHAQPGDVCCDEGAIPELTPGDVFRIDAASAADHGSKASAGDPEGGDQANAPA